MVMHACRAQSEKIINNGHIKKRQNQVESNQSVHQSNSAGSTLAIGPESGGKGT